MQLLCQHSRIREIGGLIQCLALRPEFKKKLQWLLDWNAIRGPELVAQGAAFATLLPHVLERIQQLYPTSQQQGSSLLFELLRELPTVGG